MPEDEFAGLVRELHVAREKIEELTALTEKQERRIRELEINLEALNHGKE
jgi:hypothetical protein